MVHLIKQQVEKRTTSSWNDSIAFSLVDIRILNRRKKSKGTYLNYDDFKEMLQEDAIELAIIKARKEVLKGKVSIKELTELVDKDTLVRMALEAIWP